MSGFSEKQMLHNAADIETDQELDISSEIVYNVVFFF